MLAFESNASQNSIAQAYKVYAMSQDEVFTSDRWSPIHKLFISAMLAHAVLKRWRLGHSPNRTAHAKPCNVDKTLTIAVYKPIDEVSEIVKSTINESWLAIV
ncbi:hypothetical protein ACTXT7_017606 [Hymenolepis weldensis]